MVVVVVVIVAWEGHDDMVGSERSASVRQIAYGRVRATNSDSLTIITDHYSAAQPQQIPTSTRKMRTQRQQQKRSINATVCKK